MSTVSRVLSGNYPTSAATQAKVMAAVCDLDYAANATARALAGTRTQTVALLVGSLASDFFAHIAHGVEEQATEDGRICLVSSTGSDPRRELATIQLMREQRAEAVILVGSVVADEQYHARMRQYAQSLAAAGSCLVLIGRPPLAPDVPAVSIEYDNRGGAYAATSHLLSHGHRRILYLGQRPGHTTSDARLDGYAQALDDHGVGYDESLVIPGVYGRRAATTC